MNCKQLLCGALATVLSAGCTSGAPTTPPATSADAPTTSTAKPPAAPPSPAVSPVASPAIRPSPSAAVSAGPSPAAAAATMGPSSPPPSIACTTPQRFTVRLNFVLDDEQIPYYYALNKGWYRNQCLEPEFQAGTGSTNTVQLVGNGSADMGIADTVAIIQGQAQGIDLQAFGVVYQHNPSAILLRQESLTPDQRNAPVLSPDVLYGKTYGAVIAGSPYTFYQAFLKQQKLDPSKIQQVNISPPGFTEMITKKVDFIVTFFTTAPVLQGQGVPLKVLKLEDFGQQGYGLSYFSRSQWVGQNSDVIKRFLTVTERAINYTNQNLEEGVRVLCNYNESLCKDETTVQLNAEEERLQIPLYNSLTPGKPMFCIDPQVWQNTAQLLVEAGTVQSLPDLSRSFTNANVAGCQ